ncbi:GNAT family N-acetyltransferase [Ruicaihuangia caeni]|uniref:GNAT family N-acetyltransferase n=1 Tax=Ruicaihuangia caeni TaxID=3042517 RepID=A0AAW6TAK9_9MICO|nr:GNAT family N-acetyltransferase [Klugiella sp. YN-L-19]MDI2099100.1 GNAT family N-acetyltransferase [Klugiella sp. YN-L-19]
MSVDVAAWDPESADARAELDAVLTIHKANRARLGPMPDTAFRDRAKHRGLLLGLVDGTVAGYVLYDIPRSNQIKLVHVCVGEAARGTGLARRMVESAIRLHPRRSLITASCRSDYGIDGFWQSLGMHAASERPGRALSGSILMNWVKRINVDRGLDLLESASLESGLPIAVLDTNIIGDLFSPPDVQRDHREEARELQADWLQPLVTFVVSGEVDNEISKNQDQAVRARIRADSQHLTRLSTLRPGDRTLEHALLAATDSRLLAKDPSLRKDVLHLTDAVHAGADYFVTNDSNVHLAAGGWNLSEHGIKVVRPHELIAALSPDSYMSVFRSNLIDDGDLEWVDVAYAEPGLETAFRVYDAEAKPNVFNQRLRDLLAKRKRIEVQKLVDEQGGLWALAAFELDGTTLRLQMLRAIRGERGSTVAFQLLRHFRRTAWDRGATRVEVTDGAISVTLDAALRADGFSEATPRIASLGPATAPAAALSLASAAEVVLAERRRWPLVVQGARLPTYVIPIQPRWATNLLGMNDGLLSLRRRGLGLSRELVYFSGSRIEPKDLPARILWYASSDRTTAIRKLVARSVLVDSARLPVEEALASFGKIGVLRKSEIQGAADKVGKVNVIRFQDTELLPRSVSRHDEIFKQYVKDRVQSMQQVDPQMFDDVMARQFDERHKA